VIVRNIDDGTFLTIAAHDSPVCSLTFSSDGAILATGAQDGSLDLWRTSDGAHLETLAQHTGPVTAIGFAPNADPGAQAQHLLASVEQDGTLKLWLVGGDTFETSETATRTPTTTRSTSTPLASQSPAAHPSAEPLEPTRSHLPLLILDHAAPVSSVAFAPNGELLASAGQDGVVKLWQIDDQLRDPPSSQSHDSTSTPSSAAQPIQRLIHPAPVDRIAFAPDGLTLASGSDDGVVRLWRITQTRPERKQTLEPTATTVGRRKSS
jgi:WD40 repeat protein